VLCSLQYIVEEKYIVTALYNLIEVVFFLVSTLTVPFVFVVYVKVKYYVAIAEAREADEIP
jgi:hypothetical protein